MKPAGTPVQQYLERRGLYLPNEAVNVFRWHPECVFSKGVRTGCLVALVRSIITDEPKAIHRTALEKEGAKVEIGGLSRKALGPTKGGAIKLWAGAEVSTCLGVGEGIETTLSIRLHPELAGVPVWALIDAGHMRAFPVLPGLEGLVIAVDHDQAGETAAGVLADRYEAAGVAVTLVEAAEPGADLNDLVKSRR